MSVLHPLALTLALGVSLGAGLAEGAEPASTPTPNDGTVLPFPPTPSASIAGPTLQESKHQRRVEPDRLPRVPGTVYIIAKAD